VCDCSGVAAAAELSSGHGSWRPPVQQTVHRAAPGRPSDNEVVTVGVEPLLLSGIRKLQRWLQHRDRTDSTRKGLAACQVGRLALKRQARSAARLYGVSVASPFVTCWPLIRSRTRGARAPHVRGRGPGRPRARSAQGASLDSPRWSPTDRVSRASGGLRDGRVASAAGE